MSFVRGDVRGADGKLATTATFAFGASRESNHDVTLSPPAYAPPHDGVPSFVLPVDESEDFFDPLDADARPRFTLNFEARLAHGNRPGSGASSEEDPHAYDHWVYSRHKGGRDDGGVDGVDAVVSLLALADMPPPAMLAAATSFVPVSSVQWSVHFLETEDEGGLSSMPGGWWLLRSRGEHLREGYVCAERGCVCCVWRGAACAVGGCVACGLWPMACGNGSGSGRGSGNSTKTHT